MRWHAQLVWAQVSANPSTDGLPGVAFVQKILDWGMQIALWGSLLAMLFGAALWGLAERGGNGYQASTGKQVAQGGLIGAVVAALAPEFVNALFNAAGGGAPPGP